MGQEQESRKSVRKRWCQQKRWKAFSFTQMLQIRRKGERRAPRPARACEVTRSPL